MTNDADRRSLELLLLGPMEARVDGIPVSISGARRRALLIRLALSANEVVSKDRLIDDMWGDSVPPTAAKALQVQVSQLRDMLCVAGSVPAKGDQVLVTGSSGYMLRVERDSLDTSRFEQFYPAARQALEQHQPAQARDLCRKALSLWRGPPLVDVSDESFAAADIARLEDLRLTMVEMRIEADLALGDHAHVIGELEALVVHHPLREHIWWLLALALYRSGRQAEAVRACSRLREILRDELGLDPSAEVTVLEHQIIAQDPALDIDDNSIPAFPTLDLPGYHTNLPRSTTRFIGGEGLLDAIAEQFRAGSVVTLTGTGGVGKTRAAIEFGHQHMADFERGVFFIDLASVADTGAVIGALAAALPIVQGGERSLLEILLDWIGERGVLLVVDNCEHLVVEVGDLVEELMARCSNLQILATSREALGVHSERVHTVPSLDAGGAAVELFCERARAIDTSFDPDGHLDVLVQICERLDGIPLAIELAAARMRSLSAEELLERLQDRFRLLRGSGHSTMDRHQTLRATVSWSYQLLTEDERLLFDRTSVFAGEFDLRAAETVCGFDPIDSVDAIDLVRSLVDKSMIVAVRSAFGMRYRLLETLRQYGEEQMELRGGTAPLRDRHAMYYSDLISDLNRLSRGARQVEGEQRMSIEWDNLRAAHLWSLAQGELEIAERLVEGSYQYSAFNMRHEHSGMVERTVRLGDERGRPSTAMLGMLSYWMEIRGDADGSRRIAQRGLDVALSPDHPSTANCWWTFAGAGGPTPPRSPETVAAFRHQLSAVSATPDLDVNWWAVVCVLDSSLHADPSATLSLRQQLSEIAARVQSPRLTMFVHHYDGFACLQMSPPDYPASLTAYRRVADIAQATGDPQSFAIALRCLAMASAGLAAPDALARCRDALDALLEIRHWPKIWQTLESATLALATAGRTEQAAVILGHLDSRPTAFGLEHGLCFRDRARELIEADGDHDQARLDGAQKSADALVTYAVAHCSAD